MCNHCKPAEPWLECEWRCAIGGWEISSLNSSCGCYQRREPDAMTQEQLKIAYRESAERANTGVNNE
jgi:hypothetical protein